MMILTIKKFENLWNFCHEFANKIRKPENYEYSNPNKPKNITE